MSHQASASWIVTMAGMRSWMSWNQSGAGCAVVAALQMEKREEDMLFDYCAVFPSTLMRPDLRSQPTYAMKNECTMIANSNQ